jgi:hypothetical protein
MPQATGDPQSDEPAEDGVLALGESLRLRTLVSSSGRFVFVRHDDGTVTLHDRDAGRAVWTLDTDGRPVGDITLRDDGNLVAYDREGWALWASGTGGLPVARFVVGEQEFRNPRTGSPLTLPALVLEDADGRSLWSVLRDSPGSGMPDSVTRGRRTAPITADDWRTFLAEYSADVLSTAEEHPLSRVTEQQRADGWLGTTGATEAELVALEQRLGRVLPPSYRAFLSVSDGWTNLGYFMDRLRPAAEVCWLADDPDGAELIEIMVEANEELAEWMRRSLVVSTAQTDREDWILDPGQIGADGEWSAGTWSHWGLEHAYDSFGALVERQRKSYEELRAADGRPVDPAGGAELAEEGRIAALRGHIELAIILLDRAITKGSFAAVHMRAMLGCFTGNGGFGYKIHSRNMLAAIARGEVPESVLRAEFVPMYLRSVQSDRYADRPREFAHLGDLLPTVDSVPKGDSPEGWLARAEAYIVPELPEPPRFRAALEQARSLAAAGDRQGAWRAIERGLPYWHSDEPYRAAPMVLLTDPVLREVVTKDRLRRVVTTPREVGQHGRPTS